MRTYVIVTSIVFTLVTLAHFGLIASKPESISDPVFMVSTAISTGLAIWAWITLRRAQ